MFCVSMKHSIHGKKVGGFRKGSCNKLGIGLLILFKNTIVGKIFISYRFIGLCFIENNKDCTLAALRMGGKMVWVQVRFIGVRPSGKKVYSGQ